MGYDLIEISRMDASTLYVYEIYKMYGTGVMEDPHYDGETVRTLECTEFDAWLISESINIQLYGIISKRSSWESPIYSYKKVGYVK